MTTAIATRKMTVHKGKGRYFVESASALGEGYTIQNVESVWVCSCRAFQYCKTEVKNCKHINQVKGI